MNLKRAILFSITVILFGCCNSFRVSNSCSTETQAEADSLNVDLNIGNKHITEKEKVVTDSVRQNGKVIVLNANNYININ